MVVPQAGVTQYRRPPNKVQAHKNEAGTLLHEVPVVANIRHKTIISGLGDEVLTAGASSLSLQWNADETGPPNGTLCTVCVEFMDGEQEHPERWACLPTVGPWTNWKRANSMAIRLEWSVGGKHYCCYYQTFIQHDMIKDESGMNTVGAVRPYANAEGLRRYLEQETIENPAYWYTFYGRSRVKEVKFDWLRQAWTFTDLTPPPPVARESLKSKEVIFNELLQAGFTKNDIGRQFGTIEKRLNAPRGTHFTRPSCDRCGVAAADPKKFSFVPPGVTIQSRMQKASRVQDPCAQWPAGDKNSKVCQHCFDFGMVCTWTPAYELWNPANIRKLNAISFAPRTSKTRKIKEMPDPRTIHQANQKPYLPD